ncbi:hypothetical protein ABE85_20760 [Mitsuaria sp. 7]|nr:hypothetical protein ABE85_20760 [Mitsuaria sp. 7]
MTISQFASESTATEVLQCLSAARMTPYSAAFAPASDTATLGCYQWAQALSASIHPFVGLVEVVLRNAIHRSLSMQVSAQSSASFAWYDRAVPGAIPLKGKSFERIEFLLSEGNPPMRKQPQPSPDAVVACLSFGFWPNLLEGLSNRHAPRTFTEVFPHHPHSKPPYWSREVNRQPVLLRMKRLQQLRNRVCHFEPIWKAHWFASGHQRSSHWSHTVAAFRQFHEELHQLLAWSSPESAAAYRASFGWDWFNKLCTTHAVTAFMADHANSGRLISMAAGVPVTAAV